MRIERLEPDHAFSRQSQRELEALLRQPADNKVRPCPGCSVPCPCCGSPTCTCNCSSACPYAPEEMSSDPHDHPIEPGIVPLVYSLHTVPECRPCWSCEGHEDSSGRLRKLPRAWFYVRSLVHADLVAEYLAELRIARKLSHPWLLCVVNWGNAVDTAFSIEPKLIPDQEPILHRLRRDVRTIAGGLLADIKLLARRRMADLEAVLTGTSR